MIRPMKLGDVICPFEIKSIDGKEVYVTKENWNAENQIALDLHTIEYLLQFEEFQKSKALINMIKSVSVCALAIGDAKQKERFHELLELRKNWLASN